MEEELIDSAWFEAQDGRRVLVHTFQEFVDAGTFQDPDARIAGLKRLETEDGEPLNYVDQDTVRFVHGGTQLKRAT